MSQTAFALIDNSSSDSSNPTWSRLNAEMDLGTQMGSPDRGQISAVANQKTLDTETKIEPAIPDQNLSSSVAPYYDVRIIPFPTAVSSPVARNWVTMHALQEWEGYVLEKGEEEFTARLFDLTDESSFAPAGMNQEEEAIIPLNELSDEDLKRLRPGSIFRWVIGYERSATGTKRRVSQIVLRDLPTMTFQDRREGAEWAEKVLLAMQD